MTDQERARLLESILRVLQNPRFLQWSGLANRHGFIMYDEVTQFTKEDFDRLLERTRGLPGNHSFDGMPLLPGHPLAGEGPWYNGVVIDTTGTSG